MNIKKVLSIVVFFILATLLVGGGLTFKARWSRTHKCPSIDNRLSSPSESEPTTPSEVNFSETGNIINWDSKTEAHTEKWHLLYEKPGAPAIKVNLIFDGESSYEKLSDEDNGRRAHVEGIKKGDDVKVVKLILSSG